MDWSSLQVGNWWPLLIAAAVTALLVTVWLRHKGALFPDIRLLARSSPLQRLTDRMPLLLGISTVALLLLSLMDISVSRTVVLEKQARDFLILVDTSRSMRQGTGVMRAEFPPTFERRVGVYSGEVDDPSTIPELGRYELSRESLLSFLASRSQQDRVALVYFNSQVYLMSGFTSNYEFLEQQLEAMDPYVTHGTNIRWAQEQGLDMIARYPSRNRQAIILLTDAEARSTDYLQQQMDRISSMNIPFYVLWITAETGEGISDLAREFLRSARAIGSVFTITDPGQDSLVEALREIGELEDYTYEERRHERVDLSGYFFSIARWLALLWIALLATLYHPLRPAALSGRS